MAAVLALLQPVAAQAEPQAPVSESELATATALAELTTFDENEVPTLDVAAALAVGIDQAAIDEFQAGLDRGQTEQMRQACAGITHFASNSSGGKLFLSSCATNVVVGAIGAGAGVGALVGTILSLGGPTLPVGIATGIASALVGLGAGWLATCNYMGTGVRLELRGILTCGPQ